MGKNTCRRRFRIFVLTHPPILFLNFGDTFHRNLSLSLSQISHLNEIEIFLKILKFLFLRTLSSTILSLIEFASSSVVGFDFRYSPQIFFILNSQGKETHTHTHRERERERFYNFGKFDHSIGDSIIIIHHQFFINIERDAKTIK